MTVADLIEGDGRAAAAGRRQVPGVRLVGDIGGDLGQRDHLLHVDEGLTDLAVLEAQHPQRRIEPAQQEDRRGDVADAEMA